MKKIKHIFFLLLVFNWISIFSQNKKTYNPPPSVQNLPPETHFSWVNSCSGDTTCFIDQTIRGNTYTWTVYGDTTLPPFGITHQKIIYTSINDSVTCYHFNTPGTYTVWLAAYDNHYDSSYQILTIDTLTKADFSFITCSNNFINHSLCAHSFYWDFGDGTHATNTVPNHLYADTGTYLVKLIAYNGIKSDTLIQPIYVAATAFATAGFTYIVSHDTAWFHATDTAIPESSFFWSFADGTYASGRDTVHVYKDSTAFYNVQLNSISSYCGPAFGHDSIYITQQPPPVSNFSFIHTCLGDTTCFINQSVGGITYTWSVSDSSSPTPLFHSNDTNICFQFPSTGNYLVTITTNNNYYTVATTKTVTIGTIPIAGFSFIPCSNNFSNSSGCATSFYWNFGDSTFSIQTLPNHQYADTGYYQVMLVAYNGIDSSIATQQIYVSTTSFANADFTSSISSDTLRVYANYTSVPTATYRWNFGDGIHATGKDTIHIYYDTTKFYQVTLSVTNACGTISKTDTIETIYYNNRPPSGLDFSNSILSIVPNPILNTNYINAFFNSYNDNTYLAEVYNALGQKMFEENFAFQTGINEFKISSSNLSAGVYVLVLQAGNSYIRQKFYVINTP